MRKRYVFWAHEKEEENDEKRGYLLICNQLCGEKIILKIAHGNSHPKRTELSINPPYCSHDLLKFSFVLIKQNKKVYFGEVITLITAYN